MKNKNALISRFMVAVVTFSIAGMAWASQEEAVTPEQSESEQVSSTLFGQLAAEFAQEYKAYKNNGLIGKGITLAGTYVWLNANRHPIMVAAAIAGNSKSSDLSLALAEAFVTELDPLIKDGPMRKKIDAAKAYFWLHDHKQELTAVANGTISDFPKKLAQECVTVLSPLVDKQELEKNLNQAKTAFWVRKHKNSLIGAGVIGGVACLAAAFGAGYYMGSGATAKAA